MRNWLRLFRGLALALVSTGLVLGGASLSLAEGNLSRPTGSPTLPPSATWTGSPPPLLTPPENPPSPTPVTPTLTWTLTLPPPPTNCPPPAGWVPYVVQPGDTLESLAASSQVSAAQLSQANCLLTSSLLPGVVLYLPPRPTATSVPCGPPTGWVVYIVQAGDTLFHLSQVHGVSVAELQLANCMGQSNLLKTGQKLHVPPGPPRSATASLTRTASPTRTPTGATASLSSASPSASLSATSTLASTPTNTATPTETPTPTHTATSTGSPTPTSTP